MEITKDDIGKHFYAYSDKTGLNLCNSIIKDVQAKTITSLLCGATKKSDVLIIGTKKATDDFAKKVRELRAKKDKIADAWLKEEIRKLGYL